MKHGLGLLLALLAAISTGSSNGTAPRVPQSSASPPVAPAPSIATQARSGSPAVPAGNLVLNGDFENHGSSGCDYNLTNADYTSKMDDSWGFGSANEIDIMEGACFGPLAYSGTTRVGLHTANENGASDALSLELSSPLVAGNTYRLMFAAAAVTRFDPHEGSVEVGLSTSATSFGTHVYTGGAVADVWTLHDHSFVAPLAAGYVTIRQDNSLQSWSHVDSVALLEGQASATFRNAGPNPPSYTATPPVLGQTFTGTADLVMSGHAGGLLVGFSAPLSWTLPDGWVVLTDFTDPGGELLGLPPRSGSVATWNLTLVTDPTLCGFPLSTQALLFGGNPFALSNAYDLVVGAF